ncbi:MAG: HAMP domain-containing histidine kinase [Bacteroidales bacterium]|nr:HAMP domain-containing histidine kinase [Bacteroidales bacterium]
MYPINLRELIVIVTGITILSGFLVGYLRYIAPHIRGSMYWAVGTVLISIGLMAYGFYPKPVEYVNLLITNINAFTGQCLLLVAIWKFKEKPVNYYIVIILPVLGFLVTTVFTVLYYHMGLRVAVNSFLYAVAGAFVFYEMLVPPDKALKTIFSISAFAVMIYILAMMTRAVVSFQQKIIDLMAPTIESLILFSVISMSVLVLTFGFIIMVNIRLSQDLVKQNAMKDKFFSIIAHDLKNPVGNIMGFSDLLEEKLDQQNREEAVFIANAIKQSATQTNNLIENLLEWALSQTGKVRYNPENINLHDFIRDETEYYRHFARNKQISIQAEGVKNIQVWADKNMLRTILRNLITNAIKYTQTGGNICIESRELASFAEVAVIDNGVGIRPAIIEKLFILDEKVTTRGTNDEKGTGLGLVLCKEFVEKNGGIIRLQSEPEKGTTVFFTLPLYTG